ncbi:MAG TPA: tetratricopeptide repeat protein [Prolixibacteraceae bacterium]|nr:tetratricopeptide repeat protein [Prolixibacteraceae bacterium]
MKTCLSIVFFLLYMTICGHAQGYSTNNKKAVKLFEEAKSVAGNGLYARSLQLLHEVLEMDSTFFEAYLLSSDIYQETDSIHLQVKALETAVRVRSTKYPKVFYTLGNAYYASGNYQQAIDTYNKYLEEAGASGTFVIQARQNLEKSSQAIYLVNNPVPFNVKSLGPNINTADDEYWPSLTVDGQMIIFTRLLGSGNFAGPVPDMLQEDFFTSRLIDNVWQQSEPVASVNTRDNEGAQSISSDGKLLFFTACGRRDGVGSCDIYFSRNKDGNWSEPRNAGVPVSSGTWESQPSISANGKVLYFVSNRKGGKGGMDIWKCDLLGFSEKEFPVWGPPVNLGDSVNTAGNENSPFIHPDNQTLYFASDNWAGLGGYDIFYCRKVNEFAWTKPRNIGYPINSFRDEQGLVVDASGRNAYYSSDRKGSQRRDIYTFELHPDAQPVPVTYIKGMVTDAATGEPLCASVELVDLQDTTTNSTVESCWEPGQFLVSLPLGREYAFTVAKEGYLFYSENYQLKEIM